MYNAKLLIIKGRLFFGIAYNIINLCVACKLKLTLSNNLCLIKTKLNDASKLQEI